MSNTSPLDAITTVITRTANGAPDIARTGHRLDITPLPTTPESPRYAIVETGESFYFLRDGKPFTARVPKPTTPQDVAAAFLTATGL